MSYKTQNSSRAMARALVTAWNAFKREYAAANSKVHADITSKSASGGDDWQSPVQTPDIAASASASTLPTALTRANELRALYIRHCADTLSHKVADATNAVTTAAATDLSTLETLVNDLRTQYEAHRVSTTHHYTADSTNTIASGACTDLATAITLVNQEFTGLNAHIEAAPTTPSIEIV